MALPPFHLDVLPLLMATTLEALYLWAVRRLRTPEGPLDEPAVSRRQMSWFSGGVAVIALATVWPLHDLAEHYLLSMHMVQHLLLSLVAPPMLLLGMPSWLLRRILAPRPIKAMARQLTRPFIALVLFNAVIVITHWPAWMDLSLKNQSFHLITHALLFGSATLMWWPVVSPLPEMPTLSYPGRMLYLFLQSIVPTVPASFLTFGSTPLYSFYAHVPRIWGWSTITDQTISGLIMKLVGGFLLWTVIAVIFFKWYQVEQREGWDELKWRDVEREIRGEMTRR